MRKKTHKEFVAEMKVLHPSIKVLGVYVNSRSKILIEDDFGICNVYSCALARGCSPSVHTAINKNKYIKNKFMNKHKNKYIYDKVLYVDNKIKVKITCHTHGEFNQSPNDHLNGQGCPECRLENIGWNKSRFITAANGNLCMLYKIHCWNENESFYKIGRTVHNVKGRYRSIYDMPYNYKIISVLIGDAGYIYDLENKEKRRHRHLRYKPNIWFAGETECFSKLI